MKEIKVRKNLKRSGIYINKDFEEMIIHLEKIEVKNKKKHEKYLNKAGELINSLNKLKNKKSNTKK